MPEQPQLSEKDRIRREFILNAPMWRVILTVCFPLAAYAALNNLFKVFDNIMASYVGAKSVSAVAYITQIYAMLSSIGGGLSVGGVINISRAYGEGNYTLVKKQVNTLIICSSVLSAAVLMLIPFTDTFLRLNGTPLELIEEGRGYFIFTLIDMAIGFLNGVYISIERARGNSKRILYLNLASIIVKLTTTAYFVYVVKTGIIMIGFSGVLANLVIFFSGLYFLRNKTDTFGIDLNEASFSNTVAGPIFKLGTPVIVEKFSFSAGRVIINAMSTFYGSLTVGALGISNNMSSMTLNFTGGFQDGCTSVISQNIGAKKIGRALRAFWVTMCINIAIALFGMSLTLIFLKPLTMLFATGDTYFADLIGIIYKYEAVTAVPLAVNHAATALLYGFGYTKLTLIINFCRLFVFRIPVLWYLERFCNFGSQSVGIAQMISNVLTGFTGLTISLIVLYRIKRGKHT